MMGLQRGNLAEGSETPVSSLVLYSHFSRTPRSGRSSRERPSFSAKANGTADWQETKHRCRNFGQAKVFRLLEDVAKSQKPRVLGCTSLEELLAQRDQQQRSDDADHHDGALDDPGRQVPDCQGFIEFSEQAKRKHRDEDNPNVVERPQPDEAMRGRGNPSIMKLRNST
jgi:hypothetical protein